MAGILNKGLKLSYSASTTAPITYTDLADLQESPALGGNKDSVEVTTFDDGAHTYTSGLDNYGDTLAFRFLYDKTQFATLGALSGECAWKVTLPDGSTPTTITFTGTCDVQLDGQTVNNALTYTLNIHPSSAMTIA